MHPLYYSLPFLLFPRDQTSGQSPESQPTLSSTTLPGGAIKARVVVLLAHNTDAYGEVTFSSLRWLLLFGVWTEGQSAPPSQLHRGLRSETPTTGRQRCLRASKTNRASGREKGDSGEGPSDRALLLALGRLCIIVSSNIHPITKREFRLRHHPISLSLSLSLSLLPRCVLSSIRFYNPCDGHATHAGLLFTHPSFPKYALHA